jgi:hypothetical protein
LFVYFQFLERDISMLAGTLTLGAAFPHPLGTAFTNFGDEAKEAGLSCARNLATKMEEH